jgi:hypothetical protein
MSLEIVLGLVRHLLTFGGGLLVTRGLADASVVNEAVGAIVTLVGIAWSIKIKLSLPAK